jgi:hypothetical protein
MAIVTLTTDWGLKDYYAGAIKGALLSKNANLTIVDISHAINPFDIIQAALILKNSYTHYPEGTIHLVEVNAQATEKTNHIIVQANGHYFIGADNGIFSMCLTEQPDKIIEITTDKVSSTFPSMDIYIDVVTRLAMGSTPEELGTVKDAYVEKHTLRPTVDEFIIRGSIVYIDAFGNVITNISKDLFESAQKKRPFSIVLRNHEYEINDIYTTYSSVVPSEIMALFNSAGMLEIAINQGKASTLLGLKINDNIRIEFHDLTHR